MLILRRQMKRRVPDIQEAGYWVKFSNVKVGAVFYVENRYITERWYAACVGLVAMILDDEGRTTTDSYRTFPAHMLVFVADMSSVTKHPVR